MVVHLDLTVKSTIRGKGSPRLALSIHVVLREFDLEEI